jgi:hypothetical protein
MNIEKYIHNERKNNAEYMALVLKIRPNLSFKEYIEEKTELNNALERAVDLGYIEDQYYEDHQPVILRERELENMASEVEATLTS